jgi:hypothetical protein
VHSSGSIAAGVDLPPVQPGRHNTFDSRSRLVHLNPTRRR